MDDDTIAAAKFSSCAVRLLAANAPSLAALYTTQAQGTRTLSPLHCPRCAYPSVSTRVVANSKQRTTRSTRRTKNVEDDDNKARATQIRKVQPSPSLIPPLPRTPRVRVIKTCGVCGYVTAEASDHDFYENNERLLNGRPMTLTAAHDVASSSASSMIESRLDTAEAGKDTDSQQDITIQSGAKSKGKQRIQAAVREIGALNSSAPVAQNKPLLGNVPPSPVVPALQSRTAMKRHKKKVGLQEMLARSKEQKQKSSSRESGQAGSLSTFLSGL